MFNINSGILILASALACGLQIAGNPDLRRYDDEPPKLLETCRDIFGNPYVGYFASTFNCSNFFVCYPASQGSLIAMQMTCPPYQVAPGHYEPLRWDFRSCACEYPSKTGCYNVNTDYMYRYNCAALLIGGGMKKNKTLS